MEPEEYRLMFEAELTHWWCRGLRNLVFEVIEANFKGKIRHLKILDAGCGTGLMLKELEKYGDTYGIDISNEALTFCKKRGRGIFFKSSVMHLPFRDGSFDVVISNDVLCHKLVVEDRVAIKEFYRVLKKDGILIMNLPAYNYLWRRHDERVHTKHRYLRSELYLKLKSCSFKIMKITYRSALLLFAVLFLRLKENRSDKKAAGDLKQEKGVINFVLYNYLRLENLVLHLCNIPFGTSVFCVAKK